jgi:PKD repeat protein
MKATLLLQRQQHRQVFDSFELVTAVPTEPLTVDITSSDTEGGIAPATFEFEAGVAGGTEPYTYSWDFDGEGSSDDDDVIDHTFDEAGSYDVGLTVTDSIGQSASDSMEITVEQPPAAEEVEEEVVEEVEDEEQPPAAEEVEAPEEEEEDEEDNNLGSDELFDVDDFVDDLIDRLGFDN